MNATSLQQIAQWADGILDGNHPGRAVTRVCTDSRKLERGDLFVALKGENFDGHRFAFQAAAHGAAAVMVENEFNETMPDGFPLIRVADTLQALQSLAARYRQSLPIRVIALTGSTGKTSTKDFVAAVLGEKFRVVKTEGNFNNHIGLPLTMLRAGPDDEIGVFEIGMNHPGEIAPLAALAAPEAGIITNIGDAHLEFMGTREAIALEKGRLAEALPPTGRLVIPAADAFCKSIIRRCRAAATTTGVERGDLRATVLESGFEGTRFGVRYGAEQAEVALPVPGLHMVDNALLAIAAGLYFGVTLEEAARGLARSTLTKGRLERKQLAGIDFLDDTYNANPDSMRAALRTLAVLPVRGKRIAVLGRMGELGAASETGHRSVGDEAARAGIDALLAVGGEEAGWIAQSAALSGLKNVLQLASAEAAASWLSEHARPGDLVLVKGSRAARMERVLDHPAFRS